MQLQSLILNNVYFLLMIVNMSKTYQPDLYRNSIDPRFRHFEPYKENTTILMEGQVQNRQRPAYYHPQANTWPNSAIERYRNEGNFYGAQPYIAETKTKVHIGPEKRYITPTSLYNHRVYHADTWRTEPPPYAVYRQRRLDNELTSKAQVNSNAADEPSAANAIAQEQQLRDGQQDQIYEDTAERVGEQPPAFNEQRSYHDIYMRVAGPNELNLFGHVEHGPHLFEQRFESQNKGNRYKGEVLWADDSGGYGKQSWDLAQGKL